MARLIHSLFFLLQSGIGQIYTYLCKYKLNFSPPKKRRNLKRRNFICFKKFFPIIFKFSTYSCMQNYFPAGCTTVSFCMFHSSENENYRGKLRKFRKCMNIVGERCTNIIVLHYYCNHSFSANCCNAKKAENRG